MQCVDGQALPLPTYYYYVSVPHTSSWALLVSPVPRCPAAWSSPHSSVFCLATLQRKPAMYHSRWLMIVLWPWPSVHLGQLTPTTLPQCRFVSNPCSSGLRLSLLPFAPWASLSFSGPRPVPLSLCLALLLSLCLPLSFSLCLPLSLPLRPFSFSLSAPSPGVFLVSLPHLTPPARWFLLGISPFPWRCAQQRVEEPYSFSRYRVCLLEERSLEQP